MKMLRDKAKDCETSKIAFIFNCKRNLKMLTLNAEMYPER